jgi:hypothetical protein
MPDRKFYRVGGGPEFQAVDYTALQREMVQKQWSRLVDTGQGTTCSHGEDAGPQVEAAPPEEDRAG